MTDAPATVGPYAVVRELGRGAMGRVYLATGPDGTRAAVKVIRPELAGDDRFRRRFRREVEAARLAPPRWTARVLDADPDAAGPWVATEYVPGPSLADHVREHGPLAGRSLRRFAVALFRALAALDGAGLVHRDLKPSNVLLDDGRPGRPRIVDFGIARAADDTRMTSTGALLGTPAYMAPEQALGDREIGPPADVHAAGAVLVFAATGSPPYPAASPAAVLYRKLHREPELGAMPEPERGWAARCLERDPADRPDPARLLAEARRPVRRAVAGAVAALLLVLVGGAAAWLIGGGSGPPPGSATPSTVDPIADSTVAGSGAAATVPPARPATVDGPVAQLGHRAGRVVAGVGRAYVADPDGGAVTVLDPSGRTVGRIEVGRFPAALALSPDGTRLYAALGTDPARLVAADTTSLRVTGAVDLPAGAAATVLVPDLAVAPDGRTVAVTDPRGSRVAAVDATTLRVTAERTLDAAPRALAVTPDGARVLVAGGTPGETTGIAVLGLPGLAPLATAPGPEDVRALAADPDGDRAYLADGGSTVSGAPPAPGLRVLGVGDGQVRSAVDAVRNATRLAAGPGGRWLYAVDPAAGGVTVLDTSGSADPRPAGRIRLPGDGAEDVTVSPDGRALYVAAGRTVRVYTVPA